MTTLLAQISDPHLRAGDDTAAGALGAALRTALELRPEAVLVSGDLADDGAPDSYALVKDVLSSAEVPVFALPGNHDDPELVRSMFGADEAVRCGELRVVLCDTTIPGSEAGTLDVERLATKLRAKPDAPTIVAMHHPPIAIGMPALDEIGLPTDVQAALEELLRGSPQVRRVVTGHVHRTVFGSLGGCQVVTCPGTHLQARLEIDDPGLELRPEPPAVLLHTPDVVHVQPVP